MPDHPRGSSSTQTSRHRNVASLITIFHRHASAELRTREEIAGFFNGGAVARGLVRNGILLATGETLAQVQLRVLGPGLQPNQLFTKNPGFALLNLRGGFRIGERSSFTVILENIFDKNYRTMGSGYRWSRNKCGGPVFIQFLVHGLTQIVTQSYPEGVEMMTQVLMALIARARDLDWRLTTTRSGIANRSARSRRHRTQSHRGWRPARHEQSERCNETGRT